MTDLITRLSKLDAPDREVDAEIAVLFSGDPDAYVVRPNEGAMFSHKPGWFATGDNKSHKSPEYTTSVDAAIALAARVLPFTHLVSTYHDDMACSVKIHCCPEGLSGEWKFDVKGDHEHLAVAYCIAILRASALLRAKEASKC